MLPTALACLAAWKAQRQGQGAGTMDHLVCAQSRSALGRPLDRRNARARFISACGVLGPERQEMLTIHCGRHSRASHLLAAGWPIPAVGDMLGHANLWTAPMGEQTLSRDSRQPAVFT
jgi:site-specific recombinase XerC